MLVYFFDFYKGQNLLGAWSYGKDVKIRQNMGKKCGKIWKDMQK
jgi:hypothetical protein